jgi:DNA-binding CsgD family transcriptional regulator
LVELPPGGLRVAEDVVRIASMPVRIDQRAEALLEPLRRVVPFRGAWISLLDPERREQPPLVSVGYPDELNRYMSGPAGVAEIEMLGLNRWSGVVRRLSDLPVPLDEVPAWAEYLVPAGFRGGLAAGLFTTDGRYLGVLGLSTDIAGHPTEAARDLVAMLVTTIAHAVDPMRALTAAARIVRDGQAAVVVTRSGNPVPLPGMPAHPLLHQDSALLAAVATQVAAGLDFVTFLCPYEGGGQGQVRVTVLACRQQAARYLSGVVVLSPRGDVYQLQRHELEILGLLVDDWPDDRIGTALGVPPRTVAEHVERIVTKLAAPTREVAVLRAVRQGLYIPRPLISGP